MSARLLRLWGASLLLGCVAPAAAHAQSGELVAGDVYALRLSIDVPVLSASAAVGSSWLLRGELAAPHCAPGCDRASLPAFDRPAAGRYEPAARTASDIGVLSVLVLGSGTLLLDGGVVDLAVGAEAVLATSAVAVLTMFAVRRPRPFAYGDQAPLSALLDGNASMAFPSGHTANAFATTLATFHMLHARHPRSPWPWVALGSGLALSSAVGVTRVVAGDHFPSDVLAGALLGSALGWLVPELHRVAPTLSLAPSGTAGLALSGSFE